MQKTRALQIARYALVVRKKHLNIEVDMPVCPYVLAEAMGFDVRFVKIPSFEGMYLKEEKQILISAERPAGRKRFTCAHEIGHHILGHGSVIDEVLEAGSVKAEELEADFFAGMILVPQAAAISAIRRLGKSVSDLQPTDIYILSNYFGVSYQAFLTQARFNLNIISDQLFQKLSQKSLRNVKSGILGEETKNDVVYLGSWWKGKAVELEVGDFIVADQKIKIEGPNVLEERRSDKRFCAVAVSPGLAKLCDNSGWSAFVKISRRHFSGMFQYKYEEEVE